MSTSQGPCVDEATEELSAPPFASGTRSSGCKERSRRSPAQSYQQTPLPSLQSFHQSLPVCSSSQRHVDCRSESLKPLLDFFILCSRCWFPSFCFRCTTTAEGYLSSSDLSELKYPLIDATHHALNRIT